ncbi:release factor glutamine methyltransferase [Peptostreptococcaceae bacterium pGA-8]|nr:release factor glutamine methyltransferase [Peptostreptococcaceae bacterium pGA-8]
MTLPVKELLLVGENRLRDAGIADAKVDSRTLYCHIFDLTPAQLIMEWQKTVEFDYCEKYFSLLDRRAAGEPVQYITGVQEFMGYPIKVNPSVLIPRLDTETVVEKAIEIAKEKKAKEILDLCCGSGAIGIAMAKNLPDAKITLSDVSGDAAEVARSNVNALNLSKRIDVKSGDLFEPFRGRFSKKRFDMIVSNPPYIPKATIPKLMAEVKDHEPMTALDGGEDGLDFYRWISGEAGVFLKKRGILVFEIGHDQGEAVSKLLEEHGFENVQVVKDLAGLDRTVWGQLAK